VQDVRMAPAGGWQELAEGLFTIPLEPFRANVGLVLGQERALLVDTGASLADGRELVHLARRVAADLPLEAVNTHHHFDHCFGNGAFQPEAIWGQRLCAEHLRWEGPLEQRAVVARLRETDPEMAHQVGSSPIVQPGCLFDDRVELDLGDRVVTLIHPGRGHTDGDGAVWVGETRILFAGDLVEEGDPPSFEDSFPLDWPDTLGALLELGPEKVVPGHGMVVDSAFGRRQQADLQHLADLARTGFQASRRPIDFDADTAFPAAVAQVAVRRAYFQLTATATGGWAVRQPG
jgi:glyoxylase-like metal-dependent hydrolase (beta-lactamase superfamily II)